MPGFSYLWLSAREKIQIKHSLCKYAVIRRDDMTVLLKMDFFPIATGY